MKENAIKIWNLLIAGGCTEAGAAGVLGNMDAESGLEPCRMQGDFTKGYTASRAYAEKVDSGRMSRDQFAYDSVGGGGWGLCQWTFWERKRNLYDSLKADGLSIGDLNGQVLFFIEECINRYPEVWSVISTTGSVQAASDAVLLKYERPANMYDKMTYRANLSQEYYDALSGGEQDKPAAEEEPPAEVLPEDNTFQPAPIRILRRGMSGNDVRRWQALLKAAGFDIGRAGADGIFGNDTHNATVSFQKSVRLSGDGTVGAETFDAMWRL